MAKRRANGEGSIRKRSDGRWEGRYTAGHDPETGKRITKNVLGKTQAEVREKLKRALDEAKLLDVSRMGEFTVGTWVQTWYRLYAEPHVRPSTRDYYSRFINCHIIPTFGDIKLDKLTGREIQKLYNDLLDHGRVRDVQKKNNPGLSPAYVRGLHNMLHNCLDRAVKERLILRNPTEDCIAPKIPKQEMKTLHPDHLSSYLNAAKERDALPMFFLELCTGLRKGELVALYWTDLNVERRILTVDKQATKTVGEQLKITKPKTATSVRKIALSQEAVDLLLEEHSKHPDNPYMFPSPRTGELYNPDSVVNLHKRILKDKEVAVLRPGTLARV